MVKHGETSSRLGLESLPLESVAEELRWESSSLDLRLTINSRTMKCSVTRSDVKVMINEGKFNSFSKPSSG